MKRTTIRLITLLGIALLITNFPVRAQTEMGDLEILKAFHSISSNRIFEDVSELVKEDYQGRLTGTAGYDLSAQWVANQFENIGLIPAGEDNSYFQTFTIPFTLVYPGARVALHIPVEGGELVKEYRYFDEFIPGSTSGSGTVTAETVYVGYGVTAPELNYDDYKGIDVKGKIVVMEREAPVSTRDSTRFEDWFPYSFHQYKHNNAIKHGAVGMLYNYGPIANPNNAYHHDFIYSHIGQAVMDDLFQSTGKSHAKVVNEIREKLRPMSLPLQKSVTITNKTEHFPDGEGSNIIGMLQGSDPKLKEELVVIGAHLDHLGMCYEMMPGANDNASGVATMLAIARALRRAGIQTKRSIIFVAFGAEEQAIVGSEVFLKDPQFQQENIVAFINMDGVGSGNQIAATAAKNYPDIWRHFALANERYLHQQIRTNYFSNNGRPRLDAARFMKAGIPSISFSAFGTPSVYHVPSDDIELITPEIMEDLAQLIFLAVINLSNAQ